MFGIDKLVGRFSPRTGIELLSKAMVEKLGHDVEKFQMRFFTKERRVDFLVFLPDRYPVNQNAVFLKYNNKERAHLYHFDGGEKLSNVVLHILKAYLPKDGTIDYIIVNYDASNPKLMVDAYMTINNEKQMQTIEL